MSWYFSLQYYSNVGPFDKLFSIRYSFLWDGGNPASLAKIYQPVSLTYLHPNM
jgi:hypothetical protein